MWDTPAQSKSKSEPNSKLSFTYFPDHHYHLTPRAPGCAQFKHFISREHRLVYKRAPASSLRGPGEHDWKALLLVTTELGLLLLSLWPVLMCHMAAFHRHCPGQPVEG